MRGWVSLLFYSWPLRGLGFYGWKLEIGKWSAVQQEFTLLPRKPNARSRRFWWDSEARGFIGLMID
jgi:hypothetical protein